MKRLSIKPIVRTISKLELAIPYSNLGRENLCNIFFVFEEKFINEEN